MAQAPLSGELAQQAADAFAVHGSKAAAAKAIGIPYETFRSRINVAASRGMLGTAPVLPGFRITKTTAVQDADGNIDREFVQQKPELGETFTVPDGHAVKGVSALIDGASGQVINQWVKTARDGRSLDDTVDAVQKAFAKARIKPSAAPLTVENCDADRLTVYVFADWHLGLFAWGEETDGPDWDLKIAKKVISATIEELVEQTPPSEHALVLGIGDLLHADDTKFSMTPASGNLLDTDTRYPKCLSAGCDLVRFGCEMIAAKHQKVDIALKRGNHDPTSTVALTQALRLLYEGHDRITVDTSPDSFFWQRFGVNLIGGVHGDGTKLQELPMVMANRRPKDWAATAKGTRHIHCGHMHHDHVKELGGVHVYQHRAPVVHDAYHAQRGYLGGRSMRAYTYHRKKGFRSLAEVQIT